jgi:hypothetical protein
VLKWSYGADDLGDSSPKTAVDVGCGIGGSSRHIVRKYPGSTAKGITLSPYQANRGNVVGEMCLSDSIQLCNIFSMIYFLCFIQQLITARERARPCRSGFISGG